MVIDVINAQVLSDTIAKNKKVVVCFTEPATCAPCRKLAPHLDVAAEQDGETVFVKVDLGKAEEAIFKTHQIRSVPTVMLFKNGSFDSFIVGRTGPKIVKEIA